VDRPAVPVLPVDETRSDRELRECADNACLGVVAVDAPIAAFELPAPADTAADQVPDRDRALVDAWVAHGDPSAFAALVERYQKWVFRLALAVLGPGGVGDAQDVTQEAFVRLAAHLKDFRGDSAFRTWLRRLAVNLAIDRRRHARWRKPHVSLSALDDRREADRGDDPYWSAEAAERTRAVARCLGVLHVGMRSVIHLHYWLDLPAEEIAVALQIPTGTVKSRLHRGRKLLYHAMRASGLS
jgi:RNA polymerase sigma-70 factor (ECF subfamily)